MAPRLLLLVPALLSALVFAMPAEAATAKRAAAACTDTREVPTAGNLAEVERATVCLLNDERADRGLRSLKPNQRLARAADRHVDDMVRHRYFAHDSRDGSRFSERIRASGYLNGPGSWVVGENLAWGSGAVGSAAAVVKAWMASPGHRANILNGRFRDIGIGITLGSPRGGDGATYATEFGAVTRPAGSARSAQRR